MRFDFDNYKGDYAMHCKTEEEAKDFCRVMHENDMIWCDDESYLRITRWEYYHKKTCYDFNKEKFSGMEYYEENGYTILEWSDFMNKTETVNVNLANLSEDEQKQLMALVEKSNKPANPYDFEIGMEFGVLECDGKICKCKWGNSGVDKNIFKQGNGFLTEQEAINEREKRLIHQELKMFAKMNNDGEIDWSDDDQEKYYIIFHHNIRKNFVDYLYKTQQNNVYFTSEEIAEKAIQHVGEERLKKYYFGVE